MFGYILAGTLLFFSLIQWIKWKIVSLSLLYYIEKNQYKQPNQEEMKVCTDFVTKNMVKDLIGH